MEQKEKFAAVLEEDQLETVSGGCYAGVCDECITADIHSTDSPVPDCPVCRSSDVNSYKSYGKTYYSCRSCGRVFNEEAVFA